MGCECIPNETLYRRMYVRNGDIYCTLRTSEMWNVLEFSMVVFISDCCSFIRDFRCYLRSWNKPSPLYIRCSSVLCDYWFYGSSYILAYYQRQPSPLRPHQRQPSPSSLRADPVYGPNHHRCSARRTYLCGRSTFSNEFRCILFISSLQLLFALLHGKKLI